MFEYTAVEILLSLKFDTFAYGNDYIPPVKKQVPTFILNEYLTVLFLYTKLHIPTIKKPKIALLSIS